MKITEHIYLLVQTLSQFKDADYGCIKTLNALSKLMTMLHDHIQISFNTQSALELNDKIKKVKSISELGNQVLVRKYRPSFLFKRRLRNQSLYFSAIDEFIDNINNYLGLFINEETGRQKVYSPKKDLS